MKVARIYTAAVDRVAVGVAGNVMQCVGCLQMPKKCILVGEEYRLTVFGYRVWGTEDGVWAWGEEGTADRRGLHNESLMLCASHRTILRQ